MDDKTYQLSRRSFWLSLVLAFVPAGSLGLQRGEPMRSVAQESGVRYLSEVMDRFHRTLDVYSDAFAAGNHFVARARMSSPGDEDAVPPMDEASTDNPHSGITCIEATLRSKGLNWGGWYFMNGVLEGREKAPRPNWGDVPEAGVDLIGATTIEWWARGNNGGERVEFFFSGIGRDAQNGEPIAPFHDSSPKIPHVPKVVTLTREWKRYEIPLAGVDLTYTLGAFGWTASSPANGNQDITFFIDGIRFDKPRVDEKRLLVSYETTKSSDEFDTIMRNVAYTYDNAVVLLAFLAAGERDRARLIADAFVYAQQNDPFYRDGRLRNAYQGGPLIVPPGWKPNGNAKSVRLPGWFDSKTQTWLEDQVQVGSNTGNLAWVMIALSAYSEATGDRDSLRAAEAIGDWIEKNCRDDRGDGGYTAGFERWPEDPLTLRYKATEHSIDLYAAFRRLSRLTKEEEEKERWRTRADHAKRFVISMWDKDEGKFWTGTDVDGVTKNKGVIPLDVQVWAIMALKDEGKQYWRALEYIEKQLRVGDGFDFNQDKDGVWFEGVAQAAAAYAYVGDEQRRRTLLEVLRSAQLPSGALPAASKDGLTTGFDLFNGKPWLYYQRPHIAATAWAAIAALGVNPLD